MQSPSQMQTYRRALIAALLFSAVAGGVWLACGAANQHDLGEVCSPYAEGAGGSADGGSNLGDCRPSLKCVCPPGTGTGSTCKCGAPCSIGDAGGTCSTPGFTCQAARDQTTLQTSNYCLPGDGGS